MAASMCCEKALGPWYCNPAPWSTCRQQLDPSLLAPSRLPREPVLWQVSSFSEGLPLAKPAMYADAKQRASWCDASCVLGKPTLSSYRGSGSAAQMSEIALKLKQSSSVSWKDSTLSCSAIWPGRIGWSRRAPAARPESNVPHEHTTEPSGHDAASGFFMRHAWIPHMNYFVHDSIGSICTKNMERPSLMLASLVQASSETPALLARRRPGWPVSRLFICHSGSCDSERERERQGYIYICVHISENTIRYIYTYISCWSWHEAICRHCPAMSAGLQPQEPRKAEHLPSYCLPICASPWQKRTLQKHAHSRCLIEVAKRNIRLWPDRQATCDTKHEWITAQLHHGGRLLPVKGPPWCALAGRAADTREL